MNKLWLPNCRFILARTNDLGRTFAMDQGTTPAPSSSRALWIILGSMGVVIVLALIILTMITFR